MKPEMTLCWEEMRPAKFTAHFYKGGLVEVKSGDDKWTGRRDAPRGSSEHRTWILANNHALKANLPEKVFVVSERSDWAKHWAQIMDRPFGNAAKNAVVWVGRYDSLRGLFTGTRVYVLGAPPKWWVDGGRLYSTAKGYQVIKVEDW